MTKIFTPREADALLGKIEGIFVHMDACHKRIQALGEELPAKSARPTPAAVAEAARVRSQVEFLLHAIEDDIAMISRTGAVVKDVEAGLVDFPGRVEGEDVWLCWK